MLLSNKKVMSFMRASNHAVILRETGLTYPTLKRIMNGGYDASRLSTREKLSSFIAKVQSGKYQ